MTIPDLISLWRECEKETLAIRSHIFDVVNGPYPLTMSQFISWLEKREKPDENPAVDHGGSLHHDH